MQPPLASNHAGDQPPQRPTRVRFSVLVVATAIAFVLYLDRVCIGIVGTYMQTELGLSERQYGWVMGCFFLTYALGQVPSGWLSDRFGARSLLTIYVVGWSLLTAATGLATGFITLLAARLGCGLAQAGAYPSCGGLISKWMPFAARGRASSLVAFGGRTGGAAAQMLTAYSMVWLAAPLLAVPGLAWMVQSSAAGPITWRGTLVVYGLAGLLVAAWYWRVFRNRPEEHPACNDAERALIAHGRPAGAPSPHGQVRGVPLRRLMTSRSMWLACLSAFGTNIGWVFLITWLPTYLASQYKVPLETRGVMAMLPMLIGMLGTLAGGSFTDWAARRFGLRWGRSLPLFSTRLLAAAAYFSCLAISNPWLATAAFAVVSLATDMGTGATWAYAQDVGGRNVGAVLGWANMWGNLGAFAAPILVGELLDWFDRDWNVAFLLSGSAFLLASLASLGIDATRPIAPADEEPVPQ